MKNQLYIQLYSIHGLIRSRQPELGRDADTGGQTKYVIELGKALSQRPEVGKVELFTRWIKDKRVSEDYAVPIEKVDDKFSIIRIPCGGGRYHRKELLWDHLEEYIDRCIKYIKSAGRLPDIIHGHYADAGYVCSELTKFFGIPFLQSGHSLGKPKLEKLLSDGMSLEAIEDYFNILHRIRIEESILYYADRIITSTSDEYDMLYGDYINRDLAQYTVIPPGVELDRFYPSGKERDWSEDTKVIRKTIREQLYKFFMNMDKPLILSICRPAKRKNISGLIKAFGEDAELQEMANLAIFAGIRKDIQDTSDNERDVLTEMLMLLDKYDLYGKMAIPKRHDVEFEIPELYRIAADSKGVFVNPAFTENFGLTLIEAAASGLPVISTSHGGPKDIMKNLDCGLLIEVKDFTNISNALKLLLKNQSMWERFSGNGIERTGRFYSWAAHTEAYMKVIRELTGQRKAKHRQFTNIGKKMINAKKLIVTDIDNTLLGDNSAVQELMDVLKHHPDIGFGVATGRTMMSAKAILEPHNIQPDFFIACVGAEIYYHDRGLPIFSTGWEAHIDYMWNRLRIIEALRDFSFLTYQEEENQREFKISYYVKEPKDKMIERVRQKLIKLKIKCNIIYSHNQFLDILPLRASKGRAVRYLAYRWNIPYDAILVCGDSGNDEDMLTGEMLAVVVANHSEELEKLRNRRRIHFARRSYAGGIYEGIQFYNLLQNGKENTDG